MALSNLDYQLRLSSTFKNTVHMENVFYYQANTDGSSFDLYTAWIVEVFPKIKAVQSEDVSSYKVSIINLVNEGDFYENPVEGQGSRLGSSVSPWDGWYFRYYRTTREVNNGRKTFGGIAEIDISDGQPTSGAVTLLQELGDVLQNVLNSDLANYSPSIAKTKLVPQVGDPSKMRRVPDTLFPVERVSFEEISHQVSRKF